MGSCKLSKSCGYRFSNSMGGCDCHSFEGCPENEVLLKEEMRYWKETEGMTYEEKQEWKRKQLKRSTDN